MTQTDYFKDCNSLDEARKTYYRFAMKFHPDKGGDEEMFKELANQFHSFRPEEFKYENEINDWSSKTYSGIIIALMEIPDITIEICGSWIWISGDTLNRKEQIKSIQLDDFYKRGFSAQKKMWYFSPRGYKKRSADDFDWSLLGIFRVLRLSVAHLRRKLRKGFNPFFLKFSGIYPPYPDPLYNNTPTIAHWEITPGSLTPAN